MVRKKGLGRGLDALFVGDVDDAATTTNDGLRMLRVSQMQAGQYQPRTKMDEAALQTLADSIKANGIMQPILVREVAPEQHEIIAGERRWRASQIAGLEEVPVLVREIEDEAALEMALIENIQREDLNPLEEALGIKRLIDEFAMTHEKAAKAVGRSRVAVSNLLRLLTLAGGVQTLLMESKLGMGHARALIGLDRAQQVMLANKIMQDNLSVREVEKLVRQADKAAEPKPAQAGADQDVLSLQNMLSEKLGTGVTITAKVNGTGTLKINYSNLDELEGFIKKITH